MSYIPAPEWRYYHVHPDSELYEGDALYKYSDKLFGWFYSRVIGLSEGPEYHGWEEAVIDLDTTREDNRQNGCRIWTNKGYCKYFDTHFLMRFSTDEWKEIFMNSEEPVKVSDVVNYFWKEI